MFGFKPTFGVFNRRGVFPAAESLDTIGLFARSVEDIELLSAVLELLPPRPRERVDRAPRIGLCRTPLWDKAEPESVAAIEDAAERLGRAGARVRSVTLPDSFAGLRHAARETINNYERASAMAPEWNTNSKAISSRLRERIELGRAMPHSDYLGALRLGEECRACLPAVFEHYDVLLAPCVNGEAPCGLGNTGIRRFKQSGPFCTRQRSASPLTAVPTACRLASSWSASVMRTGSCLPVPVGCGGCYKKDILRNRLTACWRGPLIDAGCSAPLLSGIRDRM